MRLFRIVARGRVDDGFRVIRVSAETWLEIKILKANIENSARRAYSMEDVLCALLEFYKLKTKGGLKNGNEWDEGRVDKDAEGTGTDPHRDAVKSCTAPVSDRTSQGTD